MHNGRVGSESGCSCVKIPRLRTENFCGRKAPELGRLSLPKAEDPRSVCTIEPDRLDLILHRLQQNFYDQPPASHRIAAAVLTDLKTLDEGPSALPH